MGAPSWERGHPCPHSVRQHAPSRLSMRNVDVRALRALMAGCRVSRAPRDARSRLTHLLIAVISILIDNRIVYLAMQDFFERDARRLVFLGVDVYARARAALKLLAPFGCHDNEAIL